MGELDGRVALITGGGSGIGLACAQAIAAAGATVAIMGRDPERLARGAATLGGAAMTCQGDTGDEADVERAVRAVRDRHGRLDIGVNSAGTGALAPVHQLPLDEWRRTMSVNLDGTFLATKHEATAMIAGGRGGAIVNVSSIAGVLTHQLMSAYCVSKAGVEMLTRCAADELGEHRIRVNAVRPGLVPTEMAAPLAGSAKVVENYLSLMPIRRLGTVEDIAQLVLFLVSDRAGWITGQIVAADGGHSLRMGPDVGLMFR